MKVGKNYEPKHFYLRLVVCVAKPKNYVFLPSLNLIIEVQPRPENSFIRDAHNIF